MSHVVDGTRTSNGKSTSIGNGITSRVSDLVATKRQLNSSTLGDSDILGSVLQQLNSTTDRTGFTNGIIIFIPNLNGAIGLIVIGNIKCVDQRTTIGGIHSHNAIDSFTILGHISQHSFFKRLIRISISNSQGIDFIIDSIRSTLQAVDASKEINKAYIKTIGGINNNTDTLLIDRSRSDSIITNRVYIALYQTLSSGFPLSSSLFIDNLNSIKVISDSNTIGLNVQIQLNCIRGYISRQDSGSSILNEIIGSILIFGEDDCCMYTIRE